MLQIISKKKWESERKDVPLLEMMSDIKEIKSIQEQKSEKAKVGRNARAFHQFPEMIG